MKGDFELLEFGVYKFQCLHTPGHTPGSISILLEIEDNKKKILFGQDLHGPIIPGVSNFEDYQKSLRKLLDLNADIFIPQAKFRDILNNILNKRRICLLTQPHLL